MTGDGWPGVVREQLQGADWDLIGDDVLPFLEPPEEEGMLALENLVRLLG